jgi:polyribonucleotide nucleotidyltransferase
VQIDVEDDGTVMSPRRWPERIERRRGRDRGDHRGDQGRRDLQGKVVSTKDFGAFIELAPGTDGMCHISELADGYVKNVTDVVKVGDVVKVKVILVDDQGRIKLSRKAAMAKAYA